MLGAACGGRDNGGHSAIKRKCNTLRWQPVKGLLTEGSGAAGWSAWGRQRWWHLGGRPAGGNAGGLRRGKPVRKQLWGSDTKGGAFGRRPTRERHRGRCRGALLGGPRPGPRASSTDGDVPRTRPGLGGTPRPRCPRASRPRAPSLTGAGGLRREEAEEAEEAPLLWGDPRA